MHPSRDGERMEHWKAESAMEGRNVEARLDTHEQVCAERYAGINGRLKRIEGWFVALIGSLIAFMASILVGLIS